jgi:GT2 family glycosyltransferase
VLKGARIGARSVIGAGAVVTGSIPAYSIAVGAPARVVGQTLARTTIVIPTYNGLDLLQKCLESIEAHTPEPHDIIVVDNGSTDGTADWLIDNRPDIDVVWLAENAGYPRGINAGLAEATGDYIVTLNNDTEVTDGWLYQMITTLETDPKCGLVGPMGDNVSGVQKGQPTRGSIETQRLTGFCLLMRRAVLERLGGMDTRFGLGNYDDDDYCLRAMIKGWACRVALGAFVHHVGFQTWGKVDADLGALLEHNRGLFMEKWGLPKDMPEEGAMVDLSAAKYIPLVEG